jgi:chitin disaccharide deacetylase
MRRRYKAMLFLFMGLLAVDFLWAQAGKTLAEQLGYAKDAKLLIIHADDLGVAHAENSATIAALEKGVINSASIMVPCPWFPEIAAYAKEHPDFDWGLHLTITSEWKYLKWDGVADSRKIPGLINEEGYFYESVEQVTRQGKAKEVEKEIRAQVEKAISAGIRPTHLDPHMNSLFGSPDFFKVYYKIGKEYKIPVLVPATLLQDPAFRKVAGDYPAPVVAHIQLHPGITPERWQQAYDSVLVNMKPGLNELVLHLAYNNEEMNAVTAGKTHWWDAAWRQRDYDYTISPQFQEALRKNNIQLVTWKQIQKLLYP